MTPKQKWTIACLVPVCLGVWVPQFFGDSETSGQVSLEGPTEAELLAVDAMPGEPGAPEPAQGGGRPRTGGDGSVGTSMQGDPAGDGTNSVQDRSRGLLVADVLKTLGASEAFRVPGSKSDAVVQGINSEEVAEPDVFTEFDSLMVNFVEEHPLRGTMAGETMRFAVFGSYRVAEGDLLPGTGALVAEIFRTGVRIEEAGLSLEVTLPPLQTRPANSSQDSRAQGAGQGGPDVPLGSAEPVTVPDAIPSN